MTSNSNPSEKITHGVSILLQGKHKAQAQTLLLRGICLRWKGSCTGHRGRNGNRLTEERLDSVFPHALGSRAARVFGSCIHLVSDKTSPSWSLAWLEASDS